MQNERLHAFSNAIQHKLEHGRQDLGLVSYKYVDPFSKSICVVPTIIELWILESHEHQCFRSDLYPKYTNDGIY